MINRFPEQKFGVKTKANRKLPREYVTNCVIALSEFINNLDSVNESKIKEARTDHSKKYEQKVDQSQTSYRKKPKLKESEANDCSSLLVTHQKFSNGTVHKQKENEMDNKNIEELDDKWNLEE